MKGATTGIMLLKLAAAAATSAGTVQATLAATAVIISANACLGDFGGAFFASSKNLL